MMSDKAAEAVRSGALLVRAPELGTIAAAGSERQSWLNGLVTSDLARRAPGDASYGLVLVKVGRILADAWVVEANERLLLGVVRERVAVVRDHLEKYLMMEDASHADVSAEYAWGFVHGPRAAELVREVPPRHGGFGGALAISGLGDGVFAVPAASFEAVLAEMTGRGPEIVVGSGDDREAFRIERYLPRFGMDFGDKTYPQEAALEKIAVSFTKGCYLGQEVVCRLEMRGHVIKKIVPLRVAGSDPPAHGTEVHSAEGKVLGNVTSATAAGEDAIALAMVRIDFTEPGRELSVAGRKATVLEPRLA